MFVLLSTTKINPTTEVDSNADTLRTEKYHIFNKLAKVAPNTYLLACGVKEK